MRLVHGRSHPAATAPPDVPAVSWARRGRLDAAVTARALEAALLLAAPAAVFLGLRVRPMAASTMIDPSFYTAYLQNGRELMDRFGPGYDYYWVRAGFIVPARVLWWLLGTLGGFYTFRYLLALVAIVPAYLLFKRLHGALAGWIAVLVVLTCPVVLTAWGSDYPDAAAVSYLVGGIACVLMPAGRRWPWTLAAGALFALAVHSQVIYAVAAAAPVLAYLAVLRLRSPGGAALDVLLLAAAAGAATLVLVLASIRLFGVGDLLSPTLRQIQVARDPAQAASFYSTTWKWLINDIYVLLPPTVVGVWLAVSWRAAGVRPQEWALAIATLLTFALHAGLQFLTRSWTLEYYLYTSVLFASTSLTLAAALARLASPAGRTRAWLLVPALVVLVPVALRPLRPAVAIELPVALAVAAATVAVALAARAPFAAGPRGRVPAAAAVLAGTTLLLVAMPVDRPLFPGQAAYFTPDYGSVLFGDGAHDVDEYVVASQLRTVVPSIHEVPGEVVLWWAPAHAPVVDRAAAQYLWYNDALPSTLPELDGPETNLLASKRSRWMVLLSADGREFDAAMAELTGRGFAPSTWRERTLASGSVHLRVRVVELTAFRPAS
jgi:hypothetical protein